MSQPIRNDAEKRLPHSIGGRPDAPAAGRFETTPPERPGHNAHVFSFVSLPEPMPVLLKQAPLHQELGDLDGVRGRAFADVVGHNPHG